MTTYIGLVRDHSVSMSDLRRGAAQDFNTTVESIKQSVLDEGQPAKISVVECGVGPLGKVRVMEQGVPVGRIEPIVNYVTSGNSTPLWDSVGAVIQECRDAARRDNALDAPDTTFLVMIITDGEENSSRQWTSRSLAEEFRRLQNTDRWTFVFRVPRGSRQSLSRLGIPDGNIMEWEQTERALAQSTQATVSGVQNYFRAVKSGQKSSTSFYADASKLSTTEVKQALTEMNGVKAARVQSHENGSAIREFCMERFGEFAPGHALYQLTKPEKVQDYKTIAIREIATGKFYSGPSARQLLGLPPYGDIKIVPAHMTGRFDIFVQSNSVNRKLVGGTTVVYVR